jgi:hypothetical protein
MSTINPQEILVRCADGLAAMMPHQIKKLAELGLVHRDGAGQWHSGMTAADLGHRLDMLGIGVCDFCCKEDSVITWDFPAETFEEPLPTGQPTLSVEGWGACDTCAELIITEQRKELTERSAREFVHRHPEAPPSMVREGLRQLHEDFWAHRSGPGRPYEAPGLDRDSS